MAVSPDGHYLAVTNNGHGKQTIDLIDLNTDRLVNQVEIGRAWLGLRFENQRPFLYASGGNDNIVIRYEWKKDRLINKDTITLGSAWPTENIGPAGLDIDDNRRLLYVVTKEDNSLYVCDLNTKAVLRRISLSTQAYTCLLNPSGTELYISAWERRPAVAPRKRLYFPCSSNPAVRSSMLIKERDGTKLEPI
jgi:DNA-binding beta-propeller fold protein YncE